jgi:hypothetical protein
MTTSPFERIDQLLKVLAAKQGWSYLGDGGVQITADLGLRLRRSPAAASGIIVEAHGNLSRMPRRGHRTWRAMSAVNDRSDARVILEMAFSLPQQQASIDTKRSQGAAWEQRLRSERKLLHGLASAFQAATGRAMVVSYGQSAEASSEHPKTSQELEQMLVKSVRINPQRTQLLVEMPNELAAGLYNLIQHYRP